MEFVLTDGICLGQRHGSLERIGKNIYNYQYIYKYIYICFNILFYKVIRCSK